MFKPNYLVNESDSIFGEANRKFLEDGFEGVSTMLRSSQSTLEVNVWNEGGIIVAIRPVSGELRLEVNGGARVFSQTAAFTHIELLGNRQYARVYHSPSPK